MAYKMDLKGSARRHLLAAQVLDKQIGAGDRPPCRAVAGYLFGLAGELAVKAIMSDSGIKPLPSDQRRYDPFYAHFPELKRMLATAHGRRAAPLRKISEDRGLFRNWDTSMRYAPTKEIRAEWVDGWRRAAEKLADQMGAL